MNEKKNLKIGASKSVDWPNKERKRKEKFP